MRKVALILVLVLVVISGAWLLTRSQNKTPSAATTTTVGKPTKHQTAWDGSSSQSYDTTFIHGNEEITLVALHYTGLNRPTGTVYLGFTTPKTGTKPPYFVQPLAFHLVSPTGRTWLPRVTPQAITSQNPPYWQVTLTFAGVPSRALGQGQLTLYITKPGGRFQLSLLPPSPPAGHYFAEKPALKVAAAKKAVKKVPVCKKHQKSTKKHPCRKK